MSAYLWRGGGGRRRGWIRYLAAVAAGALALMLAAVWTSGPLATGIGAAVTTVYGLVADLLRPQREPQDSGELLRSRSGRIPRVLHVDRPELAGVHAAEPDQVTEGGGPPPYIERDVEPELRQAVTQARFVLVVGESTAGKTRLAYEVVRSCFPRHAFVRPMTRAALAEAFRVARRRRRAVLWLDDLEDYLGAQGLTVAALATLLDARPGRVVVLATMRSEEHRRYDAREESRLTGSDRDAWRMQREVLSMAAVIRLARRWSDAECRRAEPFRHDPRIRQALNGRERFGIAEIIAAGPELLASWQNAWAPGANPRGAAVVAAAVDCRRAGLRCPVTREWLRDLHPPYLDGRGGGDLQPEDFDDAMRWACQAAYATSGLLIGNYSQGYLAFDYLLNAPDLAPVPDHLWDALLDLVAPTDAYDLGLVAHQEARLTRAVTALERARGAGIPGAAFSLAIAVGDAGQPRRAAGELRALAQERAAALGPAHPDTLAARHQLAFFTGESENLRTATTLFRELVEDTRRELGPEHPDTLAARHQLAYCTGEGGDADTAVRQLRALLDDRLRLLGAAHPQTIATRRSLIWFTGLRGETDRADREMRELLSDALRSLGPLDPHTLAIRSSLASFAALAGRADEALAGFDALAADRTTLLGVDHPHVLHTRLDQARALAMVGRPTEAAEALVRITADARRILEPGHRHLRVAEQLLGELGGR
ncbi:tetratricopeptide repeat protein [Streptomyces sp. ISL-10]|uniref:tetratricopeptide repeat protein n=1 Tax=Streptomyces sp. ISL-10 TaxID=2819172 RepID=UPI001BED2158|nr:tetratricopeptide repeat protein [Streptomyces sp. ISL-10]MBT2365784.1 tetratricopeptide repeat protein [Streptomyces sp. ISL-10]